MKKIIISIGLGMVACLSSVGQGYFVFADSSSTAVIDHFTSGTPVKSPANVIVGILWSANTAATVPSFLTGTGAGGASGTNQPLSSWLGVTSDPNFHLAMQVVGGVTNAMTAPTRTGLSLGTFNVGASGILGTQPGDVVAMYIVGWRLSDGINGFGTSDVLGWSNKIIETLGSAGTPGLALSGGMSGPFAVNPVPEPTTFAIAGLGMAAMLIARRRK